MGHAKLMEPSILLARERKARGVFPVTEIVPLQGAGSAEPLLEEARRPEPTVLFSMSHGLGAPRFGWDSPAEQRARQGALSLGRGQSLAAADLGSGPVLPGGAWRFFACYSAGTPSKSAYHRGLTELRNAGQLGINADAVLSGLPQPGDRPFVAALPQAVLENPEGPLAVLGHVDLAWSYSFQEAAGTGTRAERFQGVLRALADGKRAGAASFELLQYFAHADSELATLYGDEDQLDDAAWIKRRASTWMLRNDLRGYVLLGDPAARLAIPLRAEVDAPRRAPRRRSAARRRGTWRRWRKSCSK